MPQEKPCTGSPTVVLVRGAYADGSSSDGRHRATCGGGAPLGSQRGVVTDVNLDAIATAGRDRAV
jgi:hypothetical protein